MANKKISQIVAEKTRPDGTDWIEIEDATTGGSYKIKAQAIAATWWATPEMFAAAVGRTSIGNDATADDAPAFRAAIAASVNVRTDGSKNYYWASGDSDGSCVAVHNRALTLDLGHSNIFTMVQRTGLMVTQDMVLDVAVVAVTEQTVQPESSGFDNLVSRVEVGPGDTAGFVKGNVVKITSLDIIPGMPLSTPGQVYYTGEHAVVLSVDTGNNWIYLTAVLTDPYVTTIRIGKQRENAIHIMGGTFDHADAGLAAAWQSTHVWVAQTINARLEDITVARSYGHGIVENSNFNCSIYNSRVSNCIPSNGVGYGVFMQCSKGTRVNVKGSNCRHMVTCNPRNNGTGDYYSRKGRTFDCLIHDSQGDSCRNATFDLHGDAYGVIMANCYASHSFRGASSVGAGIQVAGDNCMIIGCLVRDCVNGIQAFNRNTDTSPGVGRGLRIVHCDVIATDRALIVENSNALDADNVECQMIGGRLAGRAVHGANNLIQITRADLLLQDVTIEPRGSGSGNIVYLASRATVRFEKCTENLTNASGGAAAWAPLLVTTPADSSCYYDLRRAEVYEPGDAAVTVTSRTAGIIRFNVPITADRIVTLPQLYSMPNIRIIRTTACTGAFKITVRQLTSAQGDPAVYTELATIAKSDCWEFSKSQAVGYQTWFPITHGEMV